MRSAIGNAFKAGESAFNMLSATSADTNAITVSVVNQAEASAFKGAVTAQNTAKPQNNEKTVSVQSLATQQTNAGEERSAASLSGADTGRNQFTIEQNGKSYNFAVDIKTTDSARTAQHKIADAINSQNTGVTASVRYDDATRKSTLVLSSKDTGAKNAFTVADRPGGGNLIETYGAGNVSEQAGDARYRVDGEERTSDTNTVSLGDGITGTLKKADTGDSKNTIRVTVEKDTNKISETIRDIVNNFNGLLKTANDNGGDRGAQSLRQRLDTISSSYSRSLANIGITRDRNGYLEIDEKKLTDAFKEGKAERNLGDENAGFIQRLSQIAERADTNPSGYLSYQSRNNMENPDAGRAENAGYDYYQSGFDRDDYNQLLNSYRGIQLSNIGLLLSAGI
jgi:flagellar capping protein FliD